MAGETKCSYWAVISHLSSRIKVNKQSFSAFNIVNKLTVKSFGPLWLQFLNLSFLQVFLYYDRYVLLQSFKNYIIIPIFIFSRKITD